MNLCQFVSINVYCQHKYYTLKLEVGDIQFYNVYKVAKGATYYSQSGATRADNG